MNTATLSSLVRVEEREKLAGDEFTASRIQVAVVELSALIRAESGEEPAGTYLVVAVDLEGTDKVVDGLPLHGLPVRPPHRIAAMLWARTESSQGATVAT